MLIRTAKITGRSHGWGSLCSRSLAPSTILHVSTLGLRQRLQDRLGEHLRLTVTQVINADPQLLGVVIRADVQRKAERTLPREVSGHEFRD